MNEKDSLLEFLDLIHFSCLEHFGGKWTVQTFPALPGLVTPLPKQTSGGCGASREIPRTLQVKSAEGLANVF